MHPYSRHAGPLPAPATGGMEMLDRARLTAFVATADPARSTTFYESTLGLRLLADDPYALVFHSNGTQLRIEKS